MGTHSVTAKNAKWFVDVGNTLSAPVIGLDGTIYVGNDNGELVAVTPDGHVQWRFQAPFSDRPFIRSSPAVSTAGLIYFIVNHGFSPGIGGSVGPAESILYSLDVVKNVRCTFPLPSGAVTTSSANVWTSGNNTNVFVAAMEGPFGGSLRVFDQECKQIAIQTWNCPHDVVGGYDWSCCSFHVEGIKDSPLDPTPAIVDLPKQVGKAIVVAGVTACGLHTFEWDPATKTLTPMWARPNARAVISSPAISEFGQVVLGQDDGHVLAFDLLTGSPLWDYDAGESVLTTPAFFLGRTEVYVASDTHVHHVDTGGSLLQKIGFSAGGSSAAVTWDRVYIGSENGLQTLQFDLSLEAADTGAIGSGAPAVGPKGTVLVAARDRLLRCYGR